MKAAILNNLDGTFQIEEIEIDVPRGREVLVEVKASGLCHSDLHFAEQDFGVPLPAVLGHELAGVVLAVGPEVREFSVGDHVVGSLIQFCGHCRACIGGRTYQCTRPEETLRDDPNHMHRLTRDGEGVAQGFGTGAFAERALVHENQLALVPKELPFAQASLLGCGTITGAGAAINTASVRPGDTVAVIGIGGVGLNVISGAKLAGASRIIAIDMQPKKADLARKFGATDFIDASAGDTVNAVQVDLRGVYMGSSNIKHDIPMYAHLYLQGKINLDDLISREINLSDINEAYKELKGGSIARSVITSF